MFHLSLEQGLAWHIHHKPVQTIRLKVKVRGLLFFSFSIIFLPSASLSNKQSIQSKHKYRPCLYKVLFVANLHKILLRLDQNALDTQGADTYVLIELTVY